MGEGGAEGGDLSKPSTSTTTTRRAGSRKRKDNPTSSSSTQPKKPTPARSFEIYSCTIRDPPHAYAQLRLASGDGDDGEEDRLDALQAHSYCTSALQQFLGLTGAAVSIDVLKVSGPEFWVRIPRQDLGRFSAAVTAWHGTASASGARTILRVVACGDWLGSLLGRDE